MPAWQIESNEKNYWRNIMKSLSLTRALSSFRSYYPSHYVHHVVGLFLLFVLLCRLSHLLREGTTPSFFSFSLFLGIPHISFFRVFSINQCLWIAGMCILCLSYPIRWHIIWAIHCLLLCLLRPSQCRLYRTAAWVARYQAD